MQQTSSNSDVIKPVKVVTLQKYYYLDSFGFIQVIKAENLFQAYQNILLEKESN
jgi:hypothetical protein